MWATERYYDLLGAVFHVRSQDAATGGEVDRLLAPFRRRRGGVPGRRRFSLLAAPEGGWRHRLYHDCRVVARSDSWSRLVPWLLSELNRAAVEEFPGFAVHAGVVADGGDVVAFPAASGDGKSTLTAACLAAGFAYVSDEALCVDFGTGLVVPYPKPLALSGWSRAAVGLTPPVPAPEPDGERPDGEGPDGEGPDGEGPDGSDDEVAVLAAELGADLAGGDLRLAHVVRLARTDGPPGLRELARSEALAQLLGLSFNHYKWPQRAFQLVARLARDARAWQLETGADPRAAADLLHDRLGAPVRTAVSLTE